MKFVPRTKHPGASNVQLSGKGSFDCVAVRFANCHFAQDDRYLFGSIQAA